jgi:propionate CoA-transferase
MAKIVSSEEVVQFIKDGATVYTTGITLGGYAEEVVKAIEKNFLATGHPHDLTLYYPSSIGDHKDRGLACLAHEGLLKRAVGGHYLGNGPAFVKMAMEDKMEAYNFPQGIMVTMARNIAARRAGIISKVGLGTFVDPRIEGGKLNQKTKACENLVEVIRLEDQEWLYYKVPKLDVALIRGSVADENGNISMYREAYLLEQLSTAQAARACGGIVIAQVEHIVKAGTLHPKEVKVPGIMVDYLVVAKPENHWQTGLTYFSPVYCGDVKVPLASVKYRSRRDYGKTDLPEDNSGPLKLDERKVIGRRAAMELFPGAVVDVGVGVPELAAVVATEEKISHLFHMVTESGGVGGVPASSHDFGCCYNPDAIIETGHQFDFFNGGGIDVAVLGVAQVDGNGNVNVSKVNGKPIGCGGFIDIAQNAKKVVFCGTFTAGGLQVSVADGVIKIIQEGKNKKFLADVEQITFSGNFAAKEGQTVLYITERAVFQLTPQGLELIEIAPGIDLEKEILPLMDFTPIIRNHKPMPHDIFQVELGAVAGVVNSCVV